MFIKNCIWEGICWVWLVIFNHSSTEQSKETNSNKDSIFSLLWDSTLKIVRDLILISLILLGIYCMWRHIKRLNKLEQNDIRTAELDSKAPTIYNTNNNIHIWLAQVEDYLDAKQITTDKAKQKIVLEKLDKTSRQIINDLIKQKKIKNYQHIEDHLKSLYGPDNQSTNDYILQFTQRKQYYRESLAQYYKSLVELSKNAYPRTPKEVLDAYIKKQFTIGLQNSTIRDQLLLHDNDNIKNAEILTKAVELQNKLINGTTKQEAYHNDNISNRSDRSNKSAYTYNQYQQSIPSYRTSTEYQQYNGNQSNQMRYELNAPHSHGSTSNRYHNNGYNRDNDGRQNVVNQRNQINRQSSQNNNASDTRNNVPKQSQIQTPSSNQTYHTDSTH